MPLMPLPLLPLSAAYAMLRQMPALRCCRIFRCHYADTLFFAYAYAAAMRFDADTPIAASRFFYALH